ncbi:MAG: universal stress protein [Bacteroidetes bacterium]|nr:universal stress protein [Bacteroidota bacterium]
MAKTTTKQSKKHRIVVPIDFSEQSVIALGQACGVAKVTGADIILVNVIEDLGMFEKYFSQKERQEIQKSIDDRLAKFAGDHSKEHGVTITFRVERGKIYDVINKIASDLNATMIIMGTSGTMGLMKFIGSNTLRVIREAKVPVISIKGKHHRKGCDNIVLPVDLTKETRQKVTYAIELAKFYRGAKIWVCSILTTDDEFIVNKLTRQLSHVKSLITGAGVKCEAEMIKQHEKKSIADLVLEFSKKADADLIMIMTQQETRFAEMFIGSSAQEMVNESEVPIMSIVPKEQPGIVETPF